MAGLGVAPAAPAGLMLLQLPRTLVAAVPARGVPGSSAVLGAAQPVLSSSGSAARVAAGALAAAAALAAGSAVRRTRRTRVHPQAASRSRCGRSGICRAAILQVGEVRTAASLLPREVLDGPYGQEVEVAFDAMHEAMHVSVAGTLLMDEKRDQPVLGLYGFDIEKAYVRNCSGGSKVTISHMALIAAISKRLQEKFPDDLILCEENTDILAKDKAFASTVANFFKAEGIKKDATPEDAIRWTQHAGSYMAAEAAAGGSPPRRYWALNPIDTTDEFLMNKHYGISLALIEDGEPVVGFIGAPVLQFDHPSRTVPHPSGCPFFFAVKGQGAWTQLVVMERDSGIYQKNHFLKGKPIPLKVGQKIKRKNDGLYDMLSTTQLHISMGSRLREDIFIDVERVAKILGSDYPKMDLSNSALKYCWLSRGEADICLFTTQGLYDTRCTERLVVHAAGALIASESGATVADLDGKPIEWCGRVLEKNRGIAAVDPGKVPMMGLVDAVKEATTTSEVLYEKRCEKRKEVAKMLSYLFQNMGKYAETEEEIEGARMVKEKGMKFLQDQEGLDQIAQEQDHRSNPLLGAPNIADNAATSSGADFVPFTPKD